MVEKATEKPLSIRHQAFVDELLKGKTASAAAIAAGYSAEDASSRGSKLMGDPRIRAALEEGRQALAIRNQVDQDWLMERLKREAEFRGTGASHSARVQALEKIAKIQGLMTDKVEHSGNMGTLIQIVKRGEEDLDES